MIGSFVVPTLAVAVSVALVVIAMWWMGRSTACSAVECRGSWRRLVYSGVRELETAHTSQHLFDPYTLTHVHHGWMYIGVLRLIHGRPFDRSAESLALVAFAIECLWEVLENTPWIVDRYRKASISRAYSGDSILNTLGDLGATSLGLVLFVVIAPNDGWVVVAGVCLVEAVCYAWFRDTALLSALSVCFPRAAV